MIGKKWRFLGKGKKNEAETLVCVSFLLVLLLLGGCGNQKGFHKKASFPVKPRTEAGNGKKKKKNKRASKVAKRERERELENTTSCKEITPSL